MEIKSIRYKSSNIFYKVVGSGKKVIFLHGFGENGNIWEHQIDFLKPYFQLIITDLPGSGQSDFIEGAAIETYAETIKLIIDQELSFNQITHSISSSKQNKNISIPDKSSLEKVTLIGHSLGGYIALAFAEKYPEYLNGLGLFHSSSFADDELKRATRKKAVSFIKANGSFAFLKTSLPGLFTKEFVASNLEKLNMHIEEGKTFRDETLIQYYEAMIKRPDRITILKTFTHPILFIIGEQDKAVPLTISLQQAYLPSISFMHILNNSAHMGMWEEIEKVNLILVDFIDNI